MERRIKGWWATQQFRDRKCYEGFLVMVEYIGAEVWRITWK